MFWLKYIQSLFKTLNQDISPNEIAAGVMMGAMIGLLPKFNLLALALWIVILMLRVNFGMATASILLFSIFGSITDPLAERLGFKLLTGIPALRGLWVALYNTPIVPFTSFNNTLVLGNLAFGLLIAVPVFFAARRFIVAYRSHLKARIMKWRIMQILQASKLYDLASRWF